MAAASSSSSSSPTTGGFTYDVFLSFRGDDTRYGFTGYLWKALKDKGINTFFDEEDLQRGEEIKPYLLQSIEESRMAVVVLSKNYASSSFCLDELSHILHSINGNGRFVLPIFYKVDPSDVRKLKGTFGEAMTTHEANSNYSTDRLEKWKKALNQVANFSGTHVNKGDKFQYKFIEEIVEEVSTMIKPMPLHVAKHPVGLGPQMEDVISRLNLGSNDKICMVGIHGIGGVGKTTLAVAVYNSVANQFQGSCYLENVRENFLKHGSTYLQKIILSETVGEKKFELTSSKQGITIIKKRLGKKKVLLLLDDVDKAEQLEAIAGSRDWFGPGSRVIITTRNTQLLTRHNVEGIYEVKLLNKEDAFELLRQEAIRTNEVTPNYMDVLNRALRYASGLPLALEVIGSHLFQKTVEECKCVLDRYERIPEPKIQTILEVSFDALDKEEKCVFLDIACVFKGHQLTYVEKILHAHYGESKKHHIDVLVEKSLIKISESGHVTLHDLIVDMGEEIVRQESPDDPGRQSRLWLSKDIVQVLEENRGTSKIEMIYFDSEIEVKWNGEAFKKMENLKTLIIKHGASLKSPKHLPNNLRVLEWWNYSGDVLSDFYPKKLAICKIGSNSTSFIGEDFLKKKFEAMRILNVNSCNFLTQIPDISGLVNLEEFSLYYCGNLIRIDDSVGLLDKLQTLSLWGCGKIKSIPHLKLPSLEKLYIGDCPNLESFAPVVDGLLGKLKILEIYHCKKLSIPQNILKLPLLQELYCRGCDGFDSFPVMVDEILSKLKGMAFIDCRNLKSFPPLKLPYLETLQLHHCPSLENFPSSDGLLGSLKFIGIYNCCKLRSIPPLKLTSLEEFYLKGCSGLESFPLGMDGSLGKLKSFLVESWRNLNSFLQFKLASLTFLRLSDCCISLENFLPLVEDGWMGKLRDLRVKCCRNHRSIPPIRYASLEKLELSCDCCLNDIQENSGYLQHIEGPHWDDTSLKELPFSFQDLTCLDTLYLKNCGIEYGGWIFPKQEKDEEKVIPRVEFLNLINCNLSNESLAIGLKWFANVKELNLSGSHFTTLPKCIEECHFLWKLILNNCEELQEIKGIPPNLNTISAFNCSSLTSSCTSKLLNQELYKFGNTNFILPGVEIPKWFDSEYMQGLSISFWFRNKFPAITLCVVSPQTCNTASLFCQNVSINGNEYSWHCMSAGSLTKKSDPKMYHLWLFHMQNQNICTCMGYDLPHFPYYPDMELIENKWNHVVVKFGFEFQKGGIYVLKENSSMEDIRFTNPEDDVNM